MYKKFLESRGGKGYSFSFWGPETIFSMKSLLSTSDLSSPLCKSLTATQWHGYKNQLHLSPRFGHNKTKKTRRNRCKEVATWQNCRRNVRVWPPNISGRTLHAILHSQQSITPAVMWKEIWKMYVPQTTHDSCALALLTSPANLDERTEWEPNKNLKRRI